MAELLIPSLVWLFTILLAGLIGARSENVGVIVAYQAVVGIAGAIVLDFLF